MGRKKKVVQLGEPTETTNETLSMVDDLFGVDTLAAEGQQKIDKINSAKEIVRSPSPPGTEDYSRMEPAATQINNSDENYISRRQAAEEAASKALDKKIMHRLKYLKNMESFDDPTKEKSVQDIAWGDDTNSGKFMDFIAGENVNRIFGLDDYGFVSKDSWAIEKKKENYGVLERFAGIGIGFLNMGGAFVMGSLDAQYENPEEWNKQNILDKTITSMGGGFTSAWESLTKKGSFGKEYGEYYEHVSGEKAPAWLEVTGAIITDPATFLTGGVLQHSARLNSIPKNLRTGKELKYAFDIGKMTPEFLREKFPQVSETALQEFAKTVDNEKGIAKIEKHLQEALEWGQNQTAEIARRKEEMFEASFKLLEPEIIKQTQNKIHSYGFKRQYDRDRLVFRKPLEERADWEKTYTEFVERSPKLKDGPDVNKPLSKVDFLAVVEDDVRFRNPKDMNRVYEHYLKEFELGADRVAKYTYRSIIKKALDEGKKVPGFVLDEVPELDKFEPVTRARKAFTDEMTYVEASYRQQGFEYIEKQKEKARKNIEKSFAKESADVDAKTKNIEGHLALTKEALFRQVEVEADKLAEYLMGKPIENYWETPVSEIFNKAGSKRGQQVGREIFKDGVSVVDEVTVKGKATGGSVVAGKSSQVVDTTKQTAAPLEKEAVEKIAKQAQAKAEALLEKAATQGAKSLTTEERGVAITHDIKTRVQAAEMTPDRIEKIVEAIARDAYDEINIDGIVTPTTRSMLLDNEDDAALQRALLESFYGKVNEARGNGETWGKTAALAKKYIGEEAAANLAASTEELAAKVIAAEISAKVHWDDLVDLAKAGVFGDEDTIARLGFKDAEEATAAWVKRASRAELQLAHMDGSKSSIGRALNAMQLTNSDLNKRLGPLKDLLTKYGTPTGDGVRELMHFVHRVDAVAGRKSAREMLKRGFYAKTRDSLFELFINNILSGVTTQIFNTGGGVIVSGYRLLENAIAAANPFNKEMTLGNLYAEGHGFLQAAQEVWGVVGRALWKSEATIDVVTRMEKQGGSYRRAISAEAWDIRKNSAAGWLVDKIGSLINAPTERFMLAEDEAIKLFNYRGSMHSQAWSNARAHAQGDKELFKAKYKELLDAPTEEMKKYSMAQARYATFQDELRGPGALGLQNLMFKRPELMFALPFHRTPINILRFITDHTGISLLNTTSQLFTDLAAGGNRRHLAMAKLATGWMSMAAGFYMASEGIITGRLTDKWREKEKYQAAGLQDYTLNIGKYHLPFDRLDPLGAFLGLTADMYEIMANTPPDQSHLSLEAFAAYTGAAIDMFKNRRYLMGAAELFKTIYTEGSDEQEMDALLKYGSKTLSAIFIPNYVKQTNRLFLDPTVREAQTVLDNVRRSIPYESRDLFPKHDAFGYELSYPRGYGPGNLPGYALRIFNISRDANDPVVLEVARLELDLGKVGKRLGNQRLTGAQQDEYERLAGHAAKLSGVGFHEALGELIYTDYYHNLPHEEKKAEIMTLRDMYRRHAVDIMKEKYPELQGAAAEDIILSNKIAAGDMTIDYDPFAYDFTKVSNPIQDGDDDDGGGEMLNMPNTTTRTASPLTLPFGQQQQQQQ